MEQHYRILNLPRNASLQEIKQASRSLLKEYHPDHHLTNQKWAEEKTKIILQAYDILVKEKKAMNAMYSEPVHYSKIKKPIPETHVVQISVYLMEITIQAYPFLVPVSNIDQIITPKQLTCLSTFAQKYQRGSDVFHVRYVFPQKATIEDQSTEKLILLLKRSNRILGIYMNNGGKVHSYNGQYYAQLGHGILDGHLFKFDPLTGRFILDIDRLFIETYSGTL